MKSIEVTGKDQLHLSFTAPQDNTFEFQGTLKSNSVPGTLFVPHLVVITASLEQSALDKLPAGPRAEQGQPAAGRQEFEKALGGATNWLR